MAYRGNNGKPRGRPQRLRDTPLTAELLRQSMHYDPETGRFTRLTAYARHKAGVPADVIHKGHGYSVVCVRGRKYLGHRLAWLYVHGEWPPMDLDHINRIRRDNRISNLRLATDSQNLRNVPKRRNNTSGFKGVSRKSKPGPNPWAASIMVAGKHVHLGSFPTREAAAAAFATAQGEHFGEFGRME